LQKLNFTWNFEEEEYIMVAKIKLYILS
jgi:hypothetical protein